MGLIRDPRAWVWKAAFRIASGEMARRRTLVELPRGLAADASESLTDLIRALAALSRRQREVVVLHLYAGYRLLEIAAMTGTTPRRPCISIERNDGSDPSWRSRMRDLKRRFGEVDLQVAQTSRNGSERRLGTGTGAAVRTGASSETSCRGRDRRARVVPRRGRLRVADVESSHTDALTRAVHAGEPRRRC